MAIWSTVRHEETMLLFVGLLVAVSCTVAPDVVQQGGARESWDPNTTKAPPPPDADLPPENPPMPDPSMPDPPVTGGAGGAPMPAAPPDAQAPASDARTIGPRPDAAPVAAPPPGPQQMCTLKFQVTTVSFGGSYAPKNVGAIWISTAQGQFVKSLTVWGRQRLRYLGTWENASGGSTVDAVTSATARNASTWQASWDCTGVSHQLVSDGGYRVNAEFTERDGSGRVMTPVNFTKGGAPVDVTPADQSNFKGIHLQVTQ
jgi:hypothetical protein